MSNVFERIYNEVKKIPKGKVATYGEIAKRVGTTPRVVGFALHRNPDPKTIPCHRVVFKGGRLSPGYAFGGIEKQKKKLESEGIVFSICKDDPCEFVLASLQGSLQGSSLWEFHNFTTFSQGNSSRPK